MNCAARDAIGSGRKSTFDAEEAVTEAVTRTWLGVQAGAQIREPAAYASTLARNVLREQRRDRRGRSCLHAPEEIPAVETKAAEDRAALETLAVFAALQLTDRQFDVLCLVRIYGLSSAEAADLLGIGRSAVRERRREAERVLTAEFIRIGRRIGCFAG
ncbi:MAG: sigma-70 family RNA polymerase sigma factor [Candidatus Brocadiae bacterium]|nr:sigma-70 family RNA polymerase sigma factor [Candidatus Brocadiia bacterium]